MKNRILLLIAFALLALAGCEKDRLTDSVAGDSLRDNQPLSIHRAKIWWDANRPLELRSEDFVTAVNIRPLWEEAVLTKYQNIEDIVLIPFDWGDLLDMEDRGRLLLALYTDPSHGQIKFRWLGYHATSDEYPRPHAQFDVNTFTGYFFQIGKWGYFEHVLRVENGVILSYAPGWPSQDTTLNTLEFRCAEEETNLTFRNGTGGFCCWWPFRWICCRPRCPDPSGGGAIRIPWQFRGGSGSSAPTTHWPPPSSTGGAGFTGKFPFHNFGPGFTPGGSTNPNLNQFFNNQIFGSGSNNQTPGAIYDHPYLGPLLKRCMDMGDFGDGEYNGDYDPEVCRRLLLVVEGLPVNADALAWLHLTRPVMFQSLANYMDSHQFNTVQRQALSLWVSLAAAGSTEMQPGQFLMLYELVYEQLAPALGLTADCTLPLRCHHAKV